MNWILIIGIAIGLAMDAFAVAIAASTSLRKVTGRQLFRMSFHFGWFQFMMPVLGWFAGRAVAEPLAAWDHWIAFGLLAFIGGKMIYEAVTRFGDEERKSDPTRGISLIVLSIATSIDALAVGFSFALIGVVAAALTLLGMQIGSRVGKRFGRRVEIAGGLVLIGIGVKILLEHLL